MASPMWHQPRLLTIITAARRSGVLGALAPWSSRSERDESGVYYQLLSSDDGARVIPTTLGATAEARRPIKSEIYCDFMQMQLLITLRRFRARRVRADRACRGEVIGPEGRARGVGH